MTQEKMEQKTVKKNYFVWVLLVFGILSRFFPLEEFLQQSRANNGLMYKAREASVEEVTRFIQEGADVNTADSLGYTPLLLAAEHNSNPEVLRVLIENGADISATVKKGPWQECTPFMLAAMRNPNPEVLRVLIQNGADVSATAREGLQWQRCTPLMLAALHNSNPEILRVLIENGADVNATIDVSSNSRGITMIMFGKGLVDNRRGITPLMVAALKNENPEVLRTLIESGANVNAADRRGATPLMWAAKEYSTLDVLRVLIEKGANVNAADADGKTPLMFALNNLRFLIENGADVNAADKRGRTPLILAARRNSNHYILPILIENGANVMAKDEDGKMALDYAELNRALKGTDEYNLLREKTLAEMEKK